MESIHKVGPYILGNTLGEGVTGRVKLAFDKDTGEQVAMKIISKAAISDKPDMSQKLDREIAVMKVISHPHVLTMFDVYQTEDFLFLVLEYAPNGELFDYLVQRGPLDSMLALKVFQQILEGVDYCHKHLISHRDLKPENLLLDADYNIKLADFGMAAMRVDECLFNTSCGSPHYASPEVVQGSPYDGMKADIWSCGVILFALVSGKLPFDDDNIRRLLAKVKAGAFTMPAYLHKDVQDLINRMLTVDPDERITIEEIKSHPWYASKNMLRCGNTDPIPKSSNKVDGDLDEEILRTLVALGHGTEEEITEKLRGDTSNHCKAFYWMLIERKQQMMSEEPEARAPPSRRGKLSRAKSDAGLKNSLSLGLRTSQGVSRFTQGLPSPKKAKVRLTRRASLKSNGHQFRDTPKGGSPEKDKPAKAESPESGPPSPTSNPTSPGRNNSGKFVKMRMSRQSSEPSDTPKKSWLPSWFGGSTADLKQMKKKSDDERIETHKPVDELTSQIEDTLEVLGASFTFSAKRDKIRAKIMKEGRSVRITLAIVRLVDPTSTTPMHVILFSRRSGDKQAYAEVCNNIRSLLSDHV
mmetsp:Transcript_8275/g.34751  ORF Transcript_8275/g.34751 Transcript_8275/m.34751 type:complete len:582 (-) Transcript_8275:80-1825(-)|eukprot:CAMPEP_0114622388 /NCGR_PEP_ID=MMETSP0168-20121206/9715_1 /TAXON_ID=95228 ORGANISM="Vannella sp., Strain DIVA3 517/6/12" /NCGR_SAMPLE_ID=MMETSP0168 /ASSEMBLY_ACC=CAM_ASM_000044 /LENGTH=581 /DNA_ID=CAMNT_0001833609 /DNA_START=74 /DNA_END=1819 /DNA_ORIENTATION=+